MLLGILDALIHAKGMNTICEIQHILGHSLQQHGPLYVFVLIAIERVILFIGGIWEIIPSGWGWEGWGFPLILFLTLGFAPVLDMGGYFQEWKSNLFLVGKVMNWKISFQQNWTFIYDIFIYLTFKYGNVKFELYLQRSGTSVVAVGRRCFVCG